MRYRIAFWSVFVAVSMAAFHHSADAGIALIVGAFLGLIGVWIDDETRGDRVMGPGPRPAAPPRPNSFTANPDAKGYPPRPRPIPLPRPKSPRESGFERDEDGALVYVDRPPVEGWKDP